MPPAGFKPAITASQRPQTHACKDVAATGIGVYSEYSNKIRTTSLWNRWCCSKFWFQANESVQISCLVPKLKKMPVLTVKLNFVSKWLGIVTPFVSNFGSTHDKIQKLAKQSHLIRFRVSGKDSGWKLHWQLTSFIVACQTVLNKFPSSNIQRYSTTLQWNYGTQRSQPFTALR
jgi:hypothetical protein